MRFRRIGSFVLAASALLVVACNRGDTAGKSGKPTMAFVMKTLNNQFFIDMEAGARQVADSVGIELIVQAPEREIDSNLQMQIVENLIERHVDVLALVPNGSREIVPAVVKANMARIPVITVDTRVDGPTLAAANGQIATFIGSDNIDGGRLAGDFVAKKLGGKGRVAVVEGIPGHETGDSRLRGFREAIAKYPEIKIVASQTANWERAQAFNVAQNMLQANPNIQAIFACNDVMALGAMEGVIAAKKSKDVMIVGFDAQEEARKAIQNGTMAATIAQNPREMGRLAVLTAYRLLHGEQVPAEQPVKIELVSRE